MGRLSSNMGNSTQCWDCGSPHRLNGFQRSRPISGPWFRPILYERWKSKRNCPKWSNVVVPVTCFYFLCTHDSLSRLGRYPGMSYRLNVKGPCESCSKSSVPIVTDVKLNLPRFLSILLHTYVIITDSFKTFGENELNMDGLSSFFLLHQLGASWWLTLAWMVATCGHTPTLVHSSVPMVTSPFQNVEAMIFPLQIWRLTSGNQT